MWYTFVVVMGHEIENIFFKVGACAADQMNFALANHLGERKTELRGAHRPREREEHLAAAVEQGAGMIMLGGHSSFGAGDWAQSEVARILPILIRPEDGMNEPENGLKLVRERPSCRI